MPAPRRPLAVTADRHLLDDLLRLAAAGGTEGDVAPDPAAARARYPGAPVVIIGVDRVGACARARLPRRPRVIVIGRGSVLKDVEQAIEMIGAAHVAVLPDAEPWLVGQFAQREEEEPE